MRDYYCTGCGAKLVEKRRWRHGFSQKTGKPLYRMELRCPNAKGWLEWLKHGMDLTVDVEEEL